MPTVKIKLLDTEIALDCDDEERLLDLSKKCEKRLLDLQKSFPGLPQFKLSLIANIIMEDAVESMSKNVEKSSGGNRSEIHEMRKTFTNTISQLINYIEHLASRIEKS